nr:RecName: Full=Histone H5 [Coturnix japonica]
TESLVLSPAPAKPKRA